MRSSWRVPSVEIAWLESNFRTRRSGAHCLVPNVTQSQVQVNMTVTGRMKKVPSSGREQGEEERRLE